MSYDASDDTLVFELRFPTAFAAMVAVSAVAGIAALSFLSLPTWLRATLSVLVALYAVGAFWRWWRRMPARLAITGDGRCRGVTAGGDMVRYGPVRDGVVWQSFVVITAGERCRRHLFITRGMVRAPGFGQLRARLRTAVSP